MYMYKRQNDKFLLKVDIIQSPTPAFNLHLMETDCEPILTSCL